MKGRITTGTVINEKAGRPSNPAQWQPNTVVNTGAEGDRMQKMVIPGRPSRGNAVRTTINKMVVRLWLLEGTANTTVVLCRRRPDCTWSRTGYHAEWGFQYVHNGGFGVWHVVNSDGWQIIKEGGLAGFTTVNQKGKLQVNAGGTATNVTLKQGGALVTSTAATVTGSKPSGDFTVENGKADGVVLESGGRPDVLEAIQRRKHGG